MIPRSTVIEGNYVFCSLSFLNPSKRIIVTSLAVIPELTGATADSQTTD